MRESHGKGPASPPDPESCADGRKAGGEALTGAHAGQPLGCEIRQSGVPTPLSEAEGHTEIGATGKPISDPAQSQTLRMRGHSWHGNREIPTPPAADGATGRPEKATSRTSGMHGAGKSDGRIVPQKPPNKDGPPTSAEVVEGRRPAKVNALPQAPCRTQSRVDGSSGLQRVREAARRDKRARFTALLHHVTVDLLRDSFYALKRQAAPGVDGVTWQEYEDGLEDRLVGLHRRVQTGTYRAQPSKRAYIPKPDGRKRPLGIAALEDKIVQQAVVTVLNQVYEVDFLGFSYGFRPGRSAHDALDALWVGVMGKKVNWVLDADIRDCFGSFSHEWMEKFIQRRIGDRRILRLIEKWLRAGVLEDGEWSETEKGTPQGSEISPLLCNVYLHYVFDLWVVLGFQYRADAERFLREW